MSTSIEGTVIDGRYEVLSRIARGGMATVYLAHDRRLDRLVAVKVMHPHLAESEQFIARFRREARAAARLSHPNAVGVFDQGMWGDSFYLTMEYIDGEDLRDTLRRVGALPVGEALEITEKILDALGAAHRRDLIHRDIKPENVLRAQDGTPKLADFGLARAISDATQASTGTVLGTVAYLAPELVTEGNVTAASDVYAVGVMLFEMITGRQPFAGEVPINIAFQHVTSQVPLASSYVPELPREVDDLIAALTARESAERLPDGNAALTELRRVLDDLSPESAAVRADVPGEPGLPDSITEEDPDSVAGPNGTSPIWVKPSSGTAAIPIGEARIIEPTPTRSRRGRWVLLALLLLLFVGAATAAYYFLIGPGANVDVPAVYGLESNDAVEILHFHDLGAVIEEEHSDTVRSGDVVRTEPEAGATVRKHSDVAVIVSLGIESFKMPEVVRLPLGDALEELSQFPEPSVVEAYSQSIDKGAVVAIEIAADVRGPDGESFAAGDVPEVGTQVPYSTEFQLTLSLGREPVSAPDVGGKTLETAISTLEDAGLKGVEAPERAFHDTIPEGSVISQDVIGDALRGDTVTLKVSKGPEFVEVPNVVWKNQASAEKALRDAGLDVVVDAPLGVILNTVRTQSVRAGTWVPKGTVVTIQVI